MFTPNFDKVVSTVVGLGVPGLILLIMISGASGLSGAAAITSALAAFGPAGIPGGLITLPIVVLVTKGITEYGIEKILKAVLKEMKRKGHTKEELINKIGKYPVSKNLKLKLKEEIKNFYDKGTVTV